MTDNYYRTGRFNVDHSTFGGYVYDYAFNGYTSMKDIADRIESDLRFDKQCRKNRELKK